MTVREAQVSADPALMALQQTALEAAMFWGTLGRGAQTGVGEYEQPLELTDSTLADLHASGPIIVAGLQSASPAEVHAALDSLNAIHQIEKIVPRDADTPRGTGEYTEGFAARTLEAIIAGDDELAAVKALRFMCHRVAQKSDFGKNMVSRYAHKIVVTSEYKDSEAKAAAEQLRHDVIEAIADGSQRQLGESLLRGLGQPNPSRTLAIWHMVGVPGKKGEEDRQSWVRDNLQTIAKLEGLERGLSAKLTETFRTRQFARCTPEMWRDMYRDRLKYPERNYAMEFVASADHNFGLTKKSAREQVFRDLRSKGIGYELHEFADEDDIVHAHQQAEQRAGFGAGITDAVIGGHASRRGIEGSPDFKINHQTVAVLRPLRAYLLGDARVFLDACSAGKLSKESASIAEEISTVLGREVTAPNRNTGLILEVDRNGRLKASYYIKPETEAKTERGLRRMVIRTRRALGHTAAYVTIWCSVGGAEIMAANELGSQSDTGMLEPTTLALVLGTDIGLTAALFYLLDRAVKTRRQRQAQAQVTTIIKPDTTTTSSEQSAE